MWCGRGRSFAKQKSFLPFLSGVIVHWVTSLNRDPAGLNGSTKPSTLGALGSPFRKKGPGGELFLLRLLFLREAFRFSGF